MNSVVYKVTATESNLVYTSAALLSYRVLAGKVMAGTTRTYLSVVVPLFNEELNVVRLYEAMISALSDTSLAGRYELILVDDGSQDGTFENLEGLAKNDKTMKVVRFRRNFGQTAAMAAGIDFASGQVIVTMDGDLQNDPRDIEELVRCVEGGADIAVGWRFDRQDKLITRKIPSWVANWIIGKITGVPIKDNGCSLKAYKSSVIKKVPLYNEMHRFIPAVSSITGARIVECKVRHHAREFGVSKYGLSRVYKVLFDLLSIKMITAFTFRPLLWFGVLSVPFLVAIGFAFVWLVIVWASAPSASLVVPGGVALLSLSAAAFLFICGVLGELISRTAKHRPATLAALTAFYSESSSNCSRERED